MSPDVLYALGLVALLGLLVWASEGNRDERMRTMGVCYFCETPCDGEDYCHGCGQYVCEACSGPEREDSPWGFNHPPDAHLRLVDRQRIAPPN